MSGNAKWVSSGDHDYTGIFAGDDHCYVRLSLAQKPNPAKANTAPGMGVKCLRSGVDSGNFVAMYSVDGQESWNFFLNTFSNHIPAAGPALLPVALKFRGETPYIQEAALKDFATFAEDGSQAASPKFPFQLEFEPHSGLYTTDRPADGEATLWKEMIELDATKGLYKIFAWDKPSELGGTRQQIGDIVLDGQLKTTKWGDEAMFIRHEDMQHDLDVHPEWKPYTPAFLGNPLDAYAEKVKWACPFANLFLQ